MNVPGGGVWSSKHTEIIRESAEGLSVATVIIQRQQTDLIRTGWSSRGGDAHTHTHTKKQMKKKNSNKITETCFCSKGELLHHVSSPGAAALLMAFVNEHTRVCV